MNFPCTGIVKCPVRVREFICDRHHSAAGHGTNDALGGPGTTGLCTGPDHNRRQHVGCGFRCPSPLLSSAYANPHPASTPTDTDAKRDTRTPICSAPSRSRFFVLPVRNCDLSEPIAARQPQIGRRAAVSPREWLLDDLSHPLNATSPRRGSAAICSNEPSVHLDRQMSVAGAGGSFVIGVTVRRQRRL
jgi:hypothetical protein